MGAPNPEKRLHANRLGTTPWLSQGPNRCFSRTNHLKGKISTAFADGQSITIAAAPTLGDSLLNHPERWPKDWPKAGRVLGVPKCVILSSFPYWACYQPGFNLYAPRDVVGFDGTYYNNYYYFDQWDWLDDEIAAVPDPNSVKLQLASGDPNAEGDGDRLICSVKNPYYQIHRDITAAFQDAKEALEAAGIGVIIPQWLPTHIAQQRNNTLTQGFSNPINFAVCDFGSDGNPMDAPYTVNWGPPYPNPADPRNTGDLAGNCPWLTNMDPGFGTNVLHIYVGHPCMVLPGTLGAPSTWSYQAWPLSPEVVWEDIIPLTNYLGGNPDSFYNGRRPIWRSNLGYSYGFTNGADWVYDVYRSPIAGFAGEYKRNSLKFRNLTTKLFSFPSATWSFPWATDRIHLDRFPQFYTTTYIGGGPSVPWETAEEAWNYGVPPFDGDPTNILTYSAPEHNVDNFFVQSCPELDGLLLLAQTTGVYNQPLHEIESAISNLFPPIQRKVESYYNGIEPGCKELFKRAVSENGLEDYGVSYEGKMPGDLLSAGGIVDYVRSHFGS